MRLNGVRGVLALFVLLVAGCGAQSSSKGLSTSTAQPSSTSTAGPSSTSTAGPSSTSTAGPSPTSTAQPSSTSTASPSSPPAPVEGPGSSSHLGDAQFCSTHTCIANFPNGNGTVVQCVDGEWSHSGGLSGACSDHGGETGAGPPSTGPPTPTTTGTTPTPATPGVNAPSRNCDPNVQATPDASCPFAENVFVAVWRSYEATGQIPSDVSAYSPTTGQTYDLMCGMRAEVADVVCNNNNDERAAIEFPLRAVQVYQGP